MASNRSGLAGVQEIQRGPLREQIRLQIKQLVLTNQLRPGQPIVIDQLAAELGVSHTPVREALAMLQHDGLVALCCEDVNAEFDLGNAFEQPLSEIWGSERYVGVINSLCNAERWKFDLCRECPMRPTSPSSACQEWADTQFCGSVESEQKPNEQVSVDNQGAIYGD